MWKIFFYFMVFFIFVLLILVVAVFVYHPGVGLKCNTNKMKEILVKIYNNWTICLLLSEDRFFLLGSSLFNLFIFFFIFVCFFFFTLFFERVMIGLQSNVFLQLSHLNRWEWCKCREVKVRYFHGGSTCTRCGCLRITFKTVELSSSLPWGMFRKVSQKHSTLHTVHWCWTSTTFAEVLILRKFDKGITEFHL